MGATPERKAPVNCENPASASSAPPVRQPCGVTPLLDWDCAQNSGAVPTSVIVRLVVALGTVNDPASVIDAPLVAVGELLVNVKLGKQVRPSVWHTLLLALLSLLC